MTGDTYHAIGPERFTRYVDGVEVERLTITHEVALEPPCLPMEVLASSLTARDGNALNFGDGTAYVCRARRGRACPQHSRPWAPAAWVSRPRWPFRWPWRSDKTSHPPGAVVG